MDVATLKVDGDMDTITLEFEERDGFPVIGEASAPSLREGIRDGRVSAGELADLLPFEIRRALRQWHLRVARRPPARTGGVVAVSPQSAELDAVPWERLANSLGLPDLCVVRVLPDRLPAGANATNAILAAGWTGAPTLHLPGIGQELAALADLDAGAVSVRVLAEPTVEEFRAAWSELRPACVHIAAPGLRHLPEGPSLAISGRTEIEFEPLAAFVDGLEHAETTRCVLLNVCNSAFGAGHKPAARDLCERLRAVTLAWYGMVEDLTAVDFARFFYTRILEGETAVAALRAFRALRSIGHNLPTTAISHRDFSDAVSTGSPFFDAAFPVLWAPSIEALGTPPLTLDNARERTARGRATARRESPDAVGAGASSTDEVPKLTVDFEPQRWINPALLRNLRPSIQRINLDADRRMDCVSIAITCDAGLGQSTVTLTRDLDRGPQPVDVRELHFPVLYQLIDGASTRRRINFTLSCSWQGRVLIETTRSVVWMGLAEWLDRPDTWHYIPAFVDPNADGVLRVLDEATVLLKKLVTPTSAFDGYQSGDRFYVGRQVEAIFNCLRDEPFVLTYINVPPLDVYLPDDALPTGQSVRTPTQVIERRRGTCHDLAILIASCLEHIGVHPLVVLKPGHTYTGFWTDAVAHTEFWQRARKDTMRLPQAPGRDWIIRSAEELRALVDAGDVCLLEATNATDRNAVFSSAVSAGAAHLTGRAGFDVAVDVRASRRAIQPI